METFVYRRDQYQIDSNKTLLDTLGNVSFPLIFSNDTQFNETYANDQIDTSILNTPLFKFKGLGLSLVKSLNTYSSCGVTVKLPLTAHFPRYDNLEYLPRLSSSVGLSYPLDCKCTFTLSLPLLTAFYGKKFFFYSYSYATNIYKQHIL